MDARLADGTGVQEDSGDEAVAPMDPAVAAALAGPLSSSSASAKSEAEATGRRVGVTLEGRSSPKRDMAAGGDGKAIIVLSRGRARWMDGSWERMGGGDK
jgi:hypothetical protein